MTPRQQPSPPSSSQHRLATPRFTSINAQHPKPTSNHAAVASASTATAEAAEASAFDDFGQRNGHTKRTTRSQLPELQDRDFQVDSILERRQGAGGVEYLVQWQESWLDPSLILRNDDGTRFVRCNGSDWPVKVVLPVSPVDEDPRECAVGWEPTWQPKSSLSGSQDLIDDFERDNPSNIPDEPSRAVVHVRAHPGGRLEACNSFSSNVFYPRAKRDYAPAMIAWSRDNGGIIAKACLRLDTKRALRFRKVFVKAERMFNLARPSHGNAAMVFIKGVVQAKPCDCCTLAGAPFPHCVTFDFAFHGACANCGFRERGTGCNYHGDAKEGVVRWVRAVGSETAPQHQLIEVANRHGSLSSVIGHGPIANGSSHDRGTGNDSSGPATADRTDHESVPGRGPSTELGSPNPFPDTVMQSPSMPVAEATDAARAATRSPSLAPLDSSPLRAMKSREQNGRATPGPSNWRKRRRAHHSHSDVGSSKRPSPAAAKQAEKVEKAASTRSTEDEDQEEDQDEVPVYRNEYFEQGQASPAQVRVILKHCDSRWRDIFDRAWRKWVSRVQPPGSPNSLTKEEFLSLHLYESLNGAVTARCPPAPPSSTSPHEIVTLK
ncbi:hypothetical protein BAUCODRAFT_333543 [Baudoinia panamericana UAMH 10762]|uniref:Chromo domain-containing protein n=1 Tax=Baudoinia panamericana (strain UAMH 10762) TaxID=717646 RepID=M2MW51_BAUPA|nr:uncharacterized protein BAUCODRAFT_333543 [Baudoinia panamericana UAMH 10762]EMC90819.1 hypothetical protein BAUCODRAFT_333543 [Baudoinia panamericana UAMH 10762]